MTPILLASGVYQPLSPVEMLVLLDFRQWQAQTHEGAVERLTADEVHLVARYRQLRAEGHGHLFIEFTRGNISKYEIKSGGQVEVMNALLACLSGQGPTQ